MPYQEYVLLVGTCLEETSRGVFSQYHVSSGDTHLSLTWTANFGIEHCIIGKGNFSKFTPSLLMSRRRLMASDDLFLLPGFSSAVEVLPCLSLFDFKVLFFCVDANGWCPRAGALSPCGIQDSSPRSKKAGERMPHVSVIRSGFQGGRRPGPTALTGVGAFTGSLGNLCLHLLAPRHLRSTPSSWAHTRWQRGTLVMRDCQGPGRQSPRAQSWDTLIHMAMTPEGSQLSKVIRGSHSGPGTGPQCWKLHPRIAAVLSTALQLSFKHG